MQYPYPLVKILRFQKSLQELLIQALLQLKVTFFYGDQTMDHSLVTRKKWKNLLFLFPLAEESL